MYFQSPENGTFKRVPQMANGRLNGTLLEQEGGLTVYYMRPFGGKNLNTTAPPPVSASPSHKLDSIAYMLVQGLPNARRRPHTPQQN
jgi:hypothetical protein